MGADSSKGTLEKDVDNNQDNQFDKLVRIILSEDIKNLELFVANNNSAIQEIRENGLTPFQLAVLYGKYVVAEWLLNHGATIMEKSDQGWTAFQEVLFEKNFEAAGEWLSSHDWMVTEKSDGGWLVVADVSRTKAAKWLLEHGATVTEKSSDGSTAFQLMVSHENYDIAKWLLSNGAKIDEKNEKGWTVFQLMVSEEKYKAAEWLLRHGATIEEKSATGRRTAFQLMVSEEKYAGAKWLLQHGATIDEKSEEGWTAFQMMVFEGKYEAAEWLLQHGATVAEKNSNGVTAFQLMVFNEKYAAAEWLLSHGASVTEEAVNGLTIFQLVVFIEKYAVAEWLLSHGATVMEKDNDGWTVFQLMVFEGKYMAAEWLLQHGATVMEKDSDGWTAFQLMVSEGKYMAAEWLLQHGAQIDEKSEHGFTAFQLMVFNEKYAAAEWLLNHGAMIDKKNVSGLTALQLTIQRNLVGAVAWLLEYGAAIPEDIATSNAEILTLLQAAQEKRKQVAAPEVTQNDNSQNSTNNNNEKSLGNDNRVMSVESPSMVDIQAKAIKLLQEKLLSLDTEKQQLQEQFKLLMEKVSHQEQQHNEHKENIQQVKEQLEELDTREKTARNEIEAKLTLLEEHFKALKQEMAEFHERIEQRLTHLLPNIADLINNDCDELERQKTELHNLHQQTIQQIAKLEAQEQSLQAISQDQAIVQNTLVDLKDNLQILNAQREILWQAHQLKEKKQKVIKAFEDDERLLLFYNTLLIKLGALLTSAQAKAGGQVVGSGGTLGEVNDKVEIFTSFVSITPFVGNTISGIINLFVSRTLSGVDAKRQENTVNRLIELATRSEYNKVIEETSMRLTRWYVPQILRLPEQAEETPTLSQVTNEDNNNAAKIKRVIKTAFKISKQKILLDYAKAPAKRIAEFAMTLIFDELEELNNKEALSQQFVRMVTEQKAPNASSYYKQSGLKKKVHFFKKTKTNMDEKLSLKFGSDVVQTKTGEKLVLQSIFTKSGIITLQGDLWGDNDGTDPSLYSYCLGTEKAAIERELRRGGNIKHTASNDNNNSQAKLYALVLFWANLFNEPLTKGTSQIAFSLARTPKPKPTLIREKIGELLSIHQLLWEEFLQQFHCISVRKKNDIEINLLPNPSTQAILEFSIAKDVVRQGFLEVLPNLKIKAIKGKGLRIHTSSPDQADAMEKLLFRLGFEEKSEQNMQTLAP